MALFYKNKKWCFLQLLWWSWWRVTFFLKLQKKGKEFGSFWFNWWEKISRMQIKNSNVLNECIMLGFPHNKEEIQVLHYCMLYTKYCIYIQRLYNQNNLDIHSCLAQLKNRLEVKYNICKKDNNQSKFEIFRFIYNNL